MPVTNALKHYLTDLDLSFDGPHSLDFVSKLQTRHISKYSFNNLAVINGDGINLETSHLVNKIVDQGLGGYCFEHNKVNFEALQMLGYDVRLLMARVPGVESTEVARTHRITQLYFDDQIFLVDVGFGGNGPVAPLRLQPDEEQISGVDRYRLIVNHHQEYELQIEQPEGYRTLYIFDNAQYSEADCIAANFYTEHFPSSKFINNLVFILKNPTQTITLRNNQLIVKNATGCQQSTITDPPTLADTIAEHFGIHLSTALCTHFFEQFLAPNLAVEKNDL